MGVNYNNTIVGVKNLFVKVFVLMFSFLFFSCKKKPPNITPAFYHWQTEFQLEASEKTYLQNFSIKKLYVKYFDVDWHASGQPLPQAEIIWKEPIPEDIELVPTVFITNRSLKKIPLEKIEELADSIFKKIMVLSADKFFNRNISEIQIDCDWSGTTKEKYFRLLSFLRKKNAEIKLSATIRLHQIKFYQQTGVPPVDKGMLMFYNVGEVADITTKNSILDLDIAKQYLENFEKYPLHLDLALPIFSWGVLFRDGKMIKLISGLSAEELRDTSRFSPPAPQGGSEKSFDTIQEESKLSDTTQKTKSEDNFPLGGLRGEDSSSFRRLGNYHIKKSTYLNGRYLYEGDEIRLESVNIEMLEETAQLLKNHLPNDDLTISFYHLDTTTIKHFPYEKLQNICHLFY